MLFAEDSQFISFIGNVKRRHDIQLTTKLSDTNLSLSFLDVNTPILVFSRVLSCLQFVNQN